MLCHTNAGACLTNNLFYKATVIAQDCDTKTYISMTEHGFKTGYNNHNYSFKHKKHSASSAISKYIWELKEEYVDNYSIKWSIL